MKFSERMGFVSPRSVIQLEFIDKELRLQIWNYLYRKIFKKIIEKDYFYNDNVRGFCEIIWSDFLKLSLDFFHYNPSVFFHHFKEYYDSSAWYIVYDILEFCYKVITFVSEIDQKEFCEDINRILETNLSGYRFVSGVLVNIIDDTSITAIENVLEDDVNVNIRNHIQDALKKLADRKNPDFRNSIKESISAVEACANILANKPKATLSEALSEIEKSGKVNIHKALKTGFNNIYGWTSDAEGIRHALNEEPTLEFEDALFMLVSCSAFIKYLLSKKERANI